MFKAPGSSITFQVYRGNLQAGTIEELQGKRLAEIKVNDDFVSENDTVSAVKKKLRTLLEKRTENEDRAQFGVTIENSEQITFYFKDYPMQDDTLFYADNFIMLPAQMQVLLHRGTSDDLVQCISKLLHRGREHIG